MTRGKTKLLFFTNNDSKRELVYEIIDKIYDDFENRICRNCEHYIIDAGGIQEWNTCDALHQVTKPDFGCNKFKEKE